MCYRGDLRATERLHNDSICLVENGGIRRVRDNDVHTSNLVYVQNWHEVEGNNDFIEVGELVRYRPYKHGIDRKYASVCGSDDYSKRTRYEKKRSKDDDLLEIINHLIQNEHLNSEQKVDVIQESISIAKRINKIT